MKMTKTLAALSLSFIVLSTVSLRAQNAGTAVQQMQTIQKNMEQQQPLVSLKAGTNAPEIYSGENEDIGPQHILRIMPRRNLFEVSVDTEYLYTDNALLSTKPITAASVWVNTITAAFAPTPFKWGPGRFAPSAGFYSQWYNYWKANSGPSLGNIDFNVQDLYLRAAYLFPNNWQVFGQFDYDRLVSQHNYNEFYHEFVPKFGVQYLYQVKDNMLVSAVLATEYHATWQSNTPNDAQDHLDEGLNLSLSYQITPKFVAQPYYRLQYSYYQFNAAHNADRNDLLNSVGLSLGYYFTPSFSLRTFVNYDARITDDNGTPSYRDYSVGLDLTYTFRF